jgi:site-specific recombinase XerD
MLSNVAIEALEKRGQKITSEFVFPSPQDNSIPRASVHAAWQCIKHAAGLPETLRLHDLRHTYASHAILSGESLYMTGKLLGHRRPQSTERYAHLSGPALATASDAVSAKIEKLLAGVS